LGSGEGRMMSSSAVTRVGKWGTRLRRRTYRGAKLKIIKLKYIIYKIIFLKM
jgi:hypothetical protein